MPASEVSASQSDEVRARKRAAADLAAVFAAFECVDTNTVDAIDGSIEVTFLMLGRTAEMLEHADSWERDELLFAYTAYLARAAASFVTWAQARWPELKAVQL